MSFSNELGQSNKNQFSLYNYIRIDSNKSSEVIDQQYCPSFLTSLNQKEYNVLKNVILPSDNPNLSLFSLNENKPLILKEESCNSHQDLMTILEEKETKSEMYI